MRALDAKSLKAERDNRNRWKISPDVLDEWLKGRPDTDRSLTVAPLDTDRSNPANTVPDTPETLARLAAAEAKVEMLTGQVADLKSDRDRMADLLEKALEPRPGFFGRIFGRG